MPTQEIPFAAATAPTGADVAVRIRNLNHYFFKDKGQAKDHVLKQLNLEFARGEVVILTGPIRLRKNHAADSDWRIAVAARR